MTTIHLTQQVDSDTLHVPELRPLIGKQVEITIREVAAGETSGNDRWKALQAVGGQDLVDPRVYRDYRELDKRQGEATTSP